MAAWILFLLILLSPSLEESLGSSSVHGVQGSSPQESQKGRHMSCSRSKSRIVRSILEDYLWGFVEQKNYTLPKKCKLHPDDMYREQEESKVDMHFNEWRCMYCNKIVRGEGFMDNHMDNHHRDRLDPDNNHCLASVCDVVHCDWYEREKLGAEIAKRKGKCQDSVAERLRKACETIAQRCFPLEDGPVARSLNDFFLRQFCDAHTCARGTKNFPLGFRRRRRTNILFYLLFVLLFLGGTGFYIIMYIHLRDAKAKSGLQRARKQRSSWFTGMGNKASGKQH